jgi:hypothetical protein
MWQEGIRCRVTAVRRQRRTAEGEDDEPIHKRLPSHEAASPLKEIYGRRDATRTGVPPRYRRASGPALNSRD